MIQSAAERDACVVGARMYLDALSGADLDEQAELLGCAIWDFDASDEHKRESLLAGVCLRVAAAGELPRA